MQTKQTAFTEELLILESKATRELKDKLRSGGNPQPPSLQIFDVFLGILIFFIVLSAFASDEKEESTTETTEEIIVHPIDEDQLPETVYKLGYNDSAYFLNDQQITYDELQISLQEIAAENRSLDEIGIQIIIDQDEQIKYQDRLINLARQTGFTNLIF
jgi:biopolymer transport protein ExbD